MTIERYESEPRMSQCVVHGDTVYLAGQVADDTARDVAGQTEEILDKIDALLARAGSDKGRLLSAQIWLADMAGYNEMNAVWNAWLPEGAAPARACVEAALAAPWYRVEIMVIAAKG